MEMICLHSMVSQLRKNDICQRVSDQVGMHTRVILPSGVNIGNRMLIEAKMKLIRLG